MSARTVAKFRVRDVLKMLEAELSQAREGTWRLLPDTDGVDVDLVEMLEEAIAEIKRLRGGEAEAGE